MSGERDALAAIACEVTEALSKVASLADTVRQAAERRAGTDDLELVAGDATYGAVLDVFSLLREAQVAAARLPAGEDDHHHACVLPGCEVRGPHLHACKCGHRWST